MWPMPRAPISRTRNRVSSVAVSAVSGSPISLLSEPGVKTVGAFCRSTWAMRSLVLVLPAEPVRATRVAPSRRTTCRARAPRAAWTSSTTIAGTPTGREASTAAAPASTTAAAKSWPSTRSPTKATKRLPGPASRESRTTGPVTRTDGSGMSCVCPPTTSAISARERAITSSSLGLLDGFAKHLAVVERTHHPGDVLSLRLALAGDEHGVGRLGAGDGGGDGRSPVIADLHLAALVGRHGRGALEHGREDREGVLGAGVVGGQDGGVGEPGRRGAHRLAFAAVAVAAAAEHDVHLRSGEHTSELQSRLDRVGLVGVVHHREVRLPLVHPLQAARHARHGGDAVGGGLRV